MKPKISVILRVLISLGLVAFLVWSMREHLPRILDTLAKTNLSLFFSAIAIFMICVLMISARLQLVLFGEGIRIAFTRVIQLSFIGYFFNNFMPTSVGGDVVKAYYVYKQTNQAGKSFIAVFMDRLLGLFSFVIIALVAVLVSWKNIDPMFKKIIFVLAGIGFVVSFLIINKTLASFMLNLLSRVKFLNLGEKLSKVYAAVHDYRNKKRLILSVVLVSIASQAVYFFVVYLLGKSLGSSIKLGSVFLIMPLVSVVCLLPSIGGLGFREGAIVLLFGPFIGTDDAFSLSILLLATLLVLGVIGAIVYVSASQFKVKRADIQKFKNDKT